MSLLAVDMAACFSRIRGKREERERERRRERERGREGVREREGEKEGEREKERRREKESFCSLISVVAHQHHYSCTLLVTSSH